MKVYDLVVIGSGAGLSVLEEAVAAGLSCALIERSLFGGTCLTRGCIPSKILVHPADLIREARHARRVGLDFRLERLDWPLLSARMRTQIDSGRALKKDLEAVPGVTLYRGTGAFTGPDTLRVQAADGSFSEPFQGRKILIAAGGRPYIPPVPGLAETGCLDYSSFFGDGFPSRPWENLVILGGGAIGVEFAHIFSAFGTRVTIVEALPDLVSGEEPEIRRLLADSFRQNGVEVLTSCQAVQASRAGGQKVLQVVHAVTGTRTELRCDEILAATGLRSNADWLGLENTGIRTGPGGWIETDEYLQTSQAGVWAIGDINGRYQFRHKANYEAEIVVANLIGQPEQKRAADYRAVPWAIFTWPQIAHVGLTEAEVRARGRRYLIGHRHYSSVAQGFAMGYESGDRDDGFIKLIADENFRILGAHIIGPQASVLIQAVVYLMHSGQTCQVEKHGWFRRARTVCDTGGTLMPMTDSIVIHPALSEVVGWVISTLHWVEPDAAATAPH